MSARTRRTGPEPIIAENESAQIKIQPQARTDLYSTFRVGGPADFLARVGTLEEIQLALQWARASGYKLTVFGGGSNMLVSDRGIRGLVLVVRRTGKQAEGDLTIQDAGNEVVVTVPAAAPLSWFGRTAAEHGWQGMTWAVGLPGNVGGAVVNNAGAHGTETKDGLVGVRIVDADGNVSEHSRAWLSPEYRRTTLKVAGNPRDLIVLDATFRFDKGDAGELKDEADKHAEYRHATQPTGACAGSIFKNPEGSYSGLVIEQAGLKGTRVGGAVVSEKHANFIVNDDGATAEDIVGLMARVQATIREQTGIELHPEIERIGEW
ncbi:MAG: UDP-N-acetylmuramate dehydrogenase [Chloroflexia bacterium]|nr:UDP-N-acetylmuramate dehydrogenase [Chloroflexia bacterium]